MIFETVIDINSHNYDTSKRVLAAMQETQNVLLHMIADFEWFPRDAQLRLKFIILDQWYDKCHQINKFRTEISVELNPGGPGSQQVRVFHVKPDTDESLAFLSTDGKKVDAPTDIFWDFFREFRKGARTAA